MAPFVESLQRINSAVQANAKIRLLHGITTKSD
jgi:hypothetical protein